VDVGEAQGQMGVCQEARDRLGAEIHKVTAATKGVPHPWISNPFGSLGDVAEIFGFFYGKPTMLSQPRAPERSPGGTLVQTNDSAQTCDQLWAGFNAADALREQEQVKPGFSAAYKAAVLGGEHFGQQILAEGCPVNDRAAFKAELDQLHLLIQMTTNSGG
jgi:hypothetical protein